MNIAFHPFSFTHHITYSDIFSYNSYTDIHIIYLVFVLFYSLFVYFMCIYDSIHVLIVYVLFRAISLFIESLYCLSEVIKCCALFFLLTWRLDLTADARVQLSPAFLMVSQKLSYAMQSIRQFRYLDMGVLTPFHTINPCVNGVSLLLLFCLVLSTTLCGSFLQ